MPKTWTGAALLVIAILAFAVFRQGGWYAIQSWVRKIFFNRPLPQPKHLRAVA